MQKFKVLDSKYFVHKSSNEFNEALSEWAVMPMYDSETEKDEFTILL